MEPIMVPIKKRRAVRRGIDVAFGFSRGHSPGRARVTIEQSFPHAGTASPERRRTLLIRPLLRLPMRGSSLKERSHATWQWVGYRVRDSVLPEQAITF